MIWTPMQLKSEIHLYKELEGPLMITQASFSSILIICSTNKFESKCAFIE